VQRPQYESQHLAGALIGDAATHPLRWPSVPSELEEPPRPALREALVAEKWTRQQKAEEPARAARTRRRSSGGRSEISGRCRMCRGQYHCRGATGGDVAGERERGPGGLRGLANSGVDTFSVYRVDDIEWPTMRARRYGKEAGQAYLAAAGGCCSSTFSPAALRGPLRSARCHGPEPLFP
jgi:hypothetical protein